MTKRAVTQQSFGGFISVWHSRAFIQTAAGESEMKNESRIDDAS